MKQGDMEWLDGMEATLDRVVSENSLKKCIELRPEQ